MAYERYVTGRGGARTHFKMADLSGLNLANRILNEIDFSGASLVGASLHGSSLLRASLYCADLRDCDLRNAKMIGADMRGASFKGARLAFAVLDNADLRAAAMMHVQPEGVSISGRSVWDHGEHDTAQSRRHGVDFSNCSLKHVSFENAKLDDVNFTGALLNGANFKGAQLTNVTMRGAVLTGVHLEELQSAAGSACRMCDRCHARFGRQSGGALRDKFRIISFGSRVTANKEQLQISTAKTCVH